VKKDRFVPDFLEHIDTRGDPILPSRVVVGGQLVLRAGQSAKRLFSLLIPQVSDAQQGRQRQPSASRLAQSMIIVHVPRCQTAGAHSIDWESTVHHFSSVESAINQVVSRRFVKKQQMQWTLRGAHLLLQTRTRVLNEDLDDLFRRGTQNSGHNHKRRSQSARRFDPRLFGALQGKDRGQATKHTPAGLIG
jgi:hypothetical protein